MHEKKIILLFCILAAIHVFVYSAGFPLFNNVDESMHFDLVLRYARGDVPRQVELISTNTATYLGLMSSHEYYERATQFPGGKYPAALWTIPAEKARAAWAARSQIWQTQYNYEISQPPLYYVLAGLWWNIGAGLGLHNGHLVYWLRFFNILLVIALVWLAYAAARLLFPGDAIPETAPSRPRLRPADHAFLRLGVPAWVAFMPQSAFYSIGNDLISALCFGLTFLLLIQWLRAETLSAGQGIALGLACAATYLSKITNVPLLAITTVAVVFKAWQKIRLEKSRESSLALAAFLCCAELPVIVWTAWCRAHFGDATGSAIKAHFLGWTTKPFTQWWHHPIFSPGGLWSYVSGQLGTFWQGELWWGGPRLCLPGTDTIYTLLSLTLLAAALPTLSPRLSNVTSAQSRVWQLALACFTTELGFFGLMSIVYDFHNCPNPSREHPYFEAGRMMLGALIPFLLLFVYGLDRVLNRFGRTVKFITLMAMLGAMLTLEIATDRPAFSSEYNWFHLPANSHVISGP